MFASAFIVGPDDGPGLALEQLCTDIGFKNVAWFSEIAEAEEQSKVTPICYFMFSSALDEDVMHGVSSLLRRSRNRQIKYAPLISFCETPTEKLIRYFLNAGFDDILIPPFHAANVKTRMQMLLGRKTVFHETSAYFGPDRRRMLGAKDRGHANRGKGGDHRRIELVRDANVGVKILKDRHFKAQEKPYGLSDSENSEHTWDVA